MSVILAKFKTSGDKLLADYSQIGSEVLLTEFLDRLISESATDDLIVYEEEEEVTYKQLHKSTVPDIINILEQELSTLFSVARKAKGSEKTQEVLNHIEDISRLNILITRYYLNSSVNINETFKLLIA